MAKKTITKAKNKAVRTKKTPKKRLVVTRSSGIDETFFEVRLTEQSLYWIIFGAAAIAFTLWLFSLDAKVRDLYDQVDANTYSTQTPVIRTVDIIQD